MRKHTGMFAAISLELARLTFASPFALPPISQTPLELSNMQPDDDNFRTLINLGGRRAILAARKVRPVVLGLIHKT